MRHLSIALALLSLFLGIQTAPSLIPAADTSNIVSKILGSFQGQSSMNLTHFFTSFDMPTCLRRCMPAMDNVGAMFEVAKNPDAMRGMCANLTEASKCATAAGCNGLFVGAISNAFQFMCMDNLDKVSSQFACIQESAADLQQVCETVCAVQSNVIDKAAKNTADELFSMKSVCNSTHCLADCYQENLPKYCEVGEDNLFDTIFSQLESLDEQQPGIFGYLKKDEQQKKTGISKILGWMMPNGCDDESMKVKIPKKIPMPDMPKSVGSPPQVRKDLIGQKTSDAESSEKSNATSGVMFPGKSANLSSAAIMIDGKLQTMQCQLLDPNGHPIMTPDFATISKILAEHFDKKSTPKPTEKTAKNEDTEKARPCRDVSAVEPRASNSGVHVFSSTITLLIISRYL